MTANFDFLIVALVLTDLVLLGSSRLGTCIRTVAVQPSLENVLVLGLIVLIRTFLSFSLEIEIEGVAPWRRAVSSGAGLIGRAAADAKRAGAEG